MRFKRVGTALVGATAFTTLTVSPSSAATSTTFEISSGGGAHSAKGTLTWLNRSVQVQGGVTDSGGAGTKVGFEGWTSDTFADTQDRPTQGKIAVNETVSYNFTLDGSAYPGGIITVKVWIYDAHADLWSGPLIYTRK